MSKQKHEDQVAQTVEEKEIQQRVETAHNARFQIAVLDDSVYPFTNYQIIGEKDVSYTVEIRSLNEKINSCSCPDYRVNTLGICKHIQGVLNFIQKKGKRRFHELSKIGSPRTEVFLHPTTHQVSIRWPKEKEDSVQNFLEPYISASESLVANPAIGVASIDSALQGTPPEIATKIRMSQHLVHWSNEQLLNQRNEDDRKQFLADVQAGKRSMQMLSHPLLPYQEAGMLHLAFQGKAILADEMGLGKTIQAIAACELLRRLGRINKVLIVAPASLKGEWEEQIARFAGLPTLLIKGARHDRIACYKKESFFYVANYEQIRSDYAEIQEIMKPDVVILDEAQRIKNWQTKTAWSVKQLKTPYAFVLTGTPIENRIEELYSIMQFVDAKILGPLFQFNQDFFGFDAKGKAIKYRNLDELNRRLQKVVLRRRKKDVEEQLPERTISNLLMPMTKEQSLRYQDYADKVAKLLNVLKKRPLTPDESKRLQKLLACMRMIADTPYILDPKCRDCPKLEELEEILVGLMEGGDHKIIIFSEWERMLVLVKELAERLKLQYAWHTGTVPQDKRREDIKKFKEDPNCKLFLTTDSGSTGLNLQVADVVINLDLPWNPARLEQRIARAWRKNQTRTVQVINLVTENTIEQRMLTTLAMKQAVADAVLDASGNVDEILLPSASRQDFIEKLEQLTGVSSIYQINKEKTSEQIKQDIIARYSDRVHLLERHEGTLFAVIDKVDPDIKGSMEEIASSPVEVLDFNTYATLQRLATQGIILFKDGAHERLFQSTLIQTTQSEKKKQKLEEATTLFKEAERQLKMANLLRTGGFAAEALAPAKAAFAKGLDVLKLLEHNIEGIPDPLKEQVNLDQDRYVPALSEWMEGLSNLLTQYALGIQAP